MGTRLVFSLNADGTVTLRCEAAAFFAHADELRRLLDAPDAISAVPSGASDDPALGPPGSREPALEPALPPEAERAELQALWGRLFPADGRPRRDLSRRSEEVLAAAWYITCKRGFPACGAADVERVLALLAPGGPTRAGGALVHLARSGWVERVRRGRYALARRAQDRVEGLLREPARGARRPRRRVAADPVPLPDLSGLSRFLRDVPTSRKWRRVLLVAYFLRTHCRVEEFDQRLIAACFRRLRGQPAPGSLAALISQVLHKRHGLLERGTGRGRYRLSSRALEELRGDSRVAEADASRGAPMSRTG
jgi:hypothetical protein